MDRTAFRLGNVYMSRGIGDCAAQQKGFAEFVLQSLQRHASGDWGDLCEEDRDENELSLTNGLRLMSRYEFRNLKVWVITEADRTATTILFPEEY